MERWITRLDMRGESPDIDAFLKRLSAFFESEGMAISHEDIGGAFRIVKFEDYDDKWMNGATDDRELE